MLGRATYARAMSANLGAIDRRLRSIEQRLERAGGQVSLSAAQGADHVGEAIASTLSRISDRFRNGDLGHEAAEIGAQAARLGNDALRRLSKEVEARPLVTIGVAISLGILVGLASHRRH
jgi:ElaB/YqjD/DUF883 family membrane-anchored ribosome-binding protein